MTVTIHAHVVARAEHTEEVEQAYRSIVDECPQEDGLLLYLLLRDLDTPEVFDRVEQWRDEDTFQRHPSTAHAARLGAALEGHIEGEMVLRRYDVLA